ncbi:MAG: hypothetical protein P8129_09545 [Anaerolineae bacterium]
MSQETQQLESHRPSPGTFLLRLLLVLGVVVAFVLLFKRATAPERPLQALLDAETRALNHADWQSFRALQDPSDPAFQRYQKTQFDSLLMARQRGEAWATAPQPSLYIVEAQRHNDQAWALVVENREADPPLEPTIEFFRREYGQWLHTGPDPDHWGPEQESHTEHVTWRYREADADLVARLAATAETLIGQVCDDVGIELEAGALSINVCYSLDCGYVIYPLQDVLDLPTPLLFGSDNEYLEYLLAHTLTDYLIARATELEKGVAGLRLATTLLDGVQYWEAAQIVGQVPPGDPLGTLRQAVVNDTLLGLYDLDDPSRTEHGALSNGEAYALVEFVVARYGRQVLPELVRAAGHHVGVVESLQEALGPDLDVAAFEADWLTFVRERYGQ